jgi:predicted amidohydrolase
VKEEMDKLIVGAWQGHSVDGDVHANVARAHEVIDQAAAAGCDFLCLPENFLTGSGSTQMHKDCAMGLDDGRLLELAAHAADKDIVTLIGLDERRGKLVANTQVVLDGGRVAGHYTKTMLTGGDWHLMGFYDDELPVFDAKGVRFGIIICHDSSFPEVAATLAWKGARIIFSPHFNSIGRDRMDDHRTIVRNNNMGIAAHYNVVVVRSNSVGHWSDGDRYGYGDSAIFGPNGAPLAEAGLFAEKLITADVGPHLKGTQSWRDRMDLRPAIIEQLHAAAMDALKRSGKSKGRAPTG